MRVAQMLLLAVIIFPTVATAQTKTAYAVLSDEGKTLTFKYEVHTLAATNEWDVSDTGTSTPGWIIIPDNNTYSEITSVVFDESFAESRP